MNNHENVPVEKNTREIVKRYLASQGFNGNHVNIHQNNWVIAKWNQKEFDESIHITSGKFGNMGVQMDKLWAEIINDRLNNKTTTIHPIQRAMGIVPVKYPEYRGPNILLLVGLEESSKRDTSDTPENTTGVQFLQWGTDGTAEAESQTGIIAATGARFDLDVHGQRSTLSQTSKYNDTATDADLTVPVTLKEAALYNKLTVGIAHSRIQFPDFALTAGERITAQINELMANLVV